MISLRSLMDLLPYYFKEQDTYKVNGKGLLERYLDIFGTYFDDQVVNSIDTLNTVLDVDNTPEIYLGYLWEFLGSLPYANPKAIDPVKWKQYFNGFNDDSTIESLSKLWLYRKDSDNDHYSLTINQVRALVKYSVALFSIRGTKRFFEILLKLYGFDVIITIGSTYPIYTSNDPDQHDFYGSDDDFYGSDDDYAGAIDSIFDTETEVTKIDSEWMCLDIDTIDKHLNCNRLVNVNFRLQSNYSYIVNSPEFARLQDRMFNLINMFLPVGVRPHIIWDGVSSGNNFVPKVNRSLEVYIDKTPIGWEASDTTFEISSEYPGWYKVKGSQEQELVNYNFEWLPLKIMVKLKDNFNNSYSQGRPPAFISDQPKKFTVAFDGENYAGKEFDDGYVFTIKPGNNGLLMPEFKALVLCEDDFNLSVNPLLVSINWLKLFNYTLFKQFNTSEVINLDNVNEYAVILIQSAFVRTYTNDANPSDDTFIDQPVLNFTTGELLTKCEWDTSIPDKGGNLIDYSYYNGEHIYVQHLFEPGIYEFVALDRPEYKITINVTRTREALTPFTDISPDIFIDKNNPDGIFRIVVNSDLNKLKDISTLPLYIEDGDGGDLWSTLCNEAGANSPLVLIGNMYNKPYYSLLSTNLYYLNHDCRDNSLSIKVAYLNKPVHKDSQYIRFKIEEHNNVDYPEDYDLIVVTINLLTGVLNVEEEFRGHNIDGEPTYRYVYGRNVVRENNIPIEDLFEIQSPVYGIIGSEGTIELKSDKDPICIRTINIPTGLSSLAYRDDYSGENHSLVIELEGLYDNEVLVKETSNPLSRQWNNGEPIVLSDPGHYRFYGVSIYSPDIVSSFVDINVFSNKYNVNYHLIAEDSDKSDDEEYMIRTRIPNSIYGSLVGWSFDFIITIDKSIVEAMDILTNDINAFDFEVLLYRGATPKSNQLINSYTATEVVYNDEEGNTLPNYQVRGTISLVWDGTYDVGSNNHPPGLYCIELHDNKHLWPNTPSYRVIDGYVVPEKFDGNLYFDVDIISTAWTSPAGQVYNIDPITGKYTWGWYKSNINQQYSVRIVRYNPAIEIPQFRLKLTNNSYGYTRVYLYKLVEDGNLWDNLDNNPYPLVLPPTLSDGRSNPHWLGEARPEEWGFPGGFNTSSNKWDYGYDGGVEGYTGRWLFTGSIYSIGDLITGPQEPGKYLFLVQQLDIDQNSINYAYLEVKEDIEYSLIVNPSVVVIQGSAVSTLVEVLSTAKYTKEDLYVTVTNPDDKELEEYQSLPYTFSAYQVGKYTFKLYRRESGGRYVYLNLKAEFIVLTDSGINPDTLVWEADDVREQTVQVATTSSVLDWTVEIPEE